MKKTTQLDRSILKTLRKYNHGDLSLFVDMSIADGVFTRVKDATPAVKRALKRLDAQDRLAVISYRHIVRTPRTR